MATYTPDLTTIANAISTDAGSWDEFNSPYNQATPVEDTQNYIQGATCYSGSTSTKSGLVFSIAYDYGSALSITTGHVVLTWIYYAVGSNLEDYATGGMRVAIGTNQDDFNAWYVGGSDYSRNPYGGWMNVAVDPDHPADMTAGAGNGGNYQWFAFMPYTINAISKGNPIAIDAIRYGRAQYTITDGTSGNPANYTEMAEDNDTGANSYGLFSYQSGSFLWKGLISYGSSSTACYFEDSNKAVIVDDAPATYTAFNQMEVVNAGSEVRLTNMSYSSLGTVSPGTFNMVDNATAYINACLFKDWYTFSFSSKSTIIGATFLRCDSVTQSGASMSNTVFNRSIGSAALYMNTVSEISDLSFISSGSGWAIEGFSSTGSYTLNSVTYDGYDSGTGPSGNTGDRALHVLATAGTATIYYPGGDLPSYYSEGATVDLIGASYDFKFTLTPNITGYEWRIYEVTAIGSLAGAVELDGEETGTINYQTYTYQYAAPQNIAVQILSQQVRDYEESTTYYVLADADQDVIITLTPDENN